MHPAPAGTGRGRVYAWAGLLFLATFAVYLNAIPNGFVYDDHAQIEANPWIRDFSHLGEIFSNPTWGYAGKGGSAYYRPFMHVFYALVHGAAGIDPLAFHLANVVLHAVNSVLAFLVAGKFYRLADGERRDALAFAAISGAIFAFHPVQTEVAALIAAIPELSYTLFVLAALLAYPFGEPRDAGWRYPATILLSALFAFLSLLCKETAFMLFPIVVAGELLFPSRSPIFRFANIRRLLFRLAPFLAGMAVYLAIRMQVFGGLVPAQGGQAWPFAKTVMTALFLAGKYLSLLVVPVNLNFQHVIPAVTSVRDPGFAAMAGVVALSAILLVRSVARDRLASMGWAILILPIVPVLYPPVLGSLFGEHNLYLPALGFSILAARLATAVGARFPAARTAVAGVTIAYLLLLAAGTVARNPVYRDDATLWRDVGEKSGDLSPYHFQRGYRLLEEGNIEEGVREMARALSLRPDYPHAAYNLGIAYTMLGRDDDARVYLERAIRERPRDAVARFALAALHFRQGRLLESRLEYEAVVRLDPSNMEARAHLDTLERMLREKR